MMSVILLRNVISLTCNGIFQDKKMLLHSQQADEEIHQSLSLTALMHMHFYWKNLTAT